MELLAHLKESVDETSMNNPAVTNLASETKKLDEAVKSQIRYSRLNNLEIHGIPFNKNEDVIDLVCAVSDKFGISVKGYHIDAAHRLNKRKSAIKPIIVKFVNRWKKEDLYESRKKKKVYASDLGFDSPLRIYLNENLTQEKGLLSMEARTFFKNKECHVSSFAGNVYVEKKIV